MHICARRRPGFVRPFRARPDGGTPAVSYTYDGTACRAQAGDGWGTGAEVAQGSYGELSALRFAGVAAKACSFAGATVVLMADGSKKPIEDIEAGDKVIATDPETGEQVAKTVEHVWVHDDTVTDMVVGGEVITTTEDHPFWSVTDQRFERANQLVSGERVLAADGRVIAVSGFEAETARAALAYNLTVNDVHTYHVGLSAVLVHNAGCISSVIGNDPSLVKAAQAAGKNPQVQREMDGLSAQLSAGNMNPGIGTKALTGTDILYARSRGGARLFFRNVDGGIQIVGKASKANESSVINRLMSLYGS